MSKLERSKLERIRKIIELNDARELTDLKIVELATRTRKDENMMSEVLYYELEAGEFEFYKRISKPDSDALVDELKQELYKYVERHNRNLDNEKYENQIVDGLMFTFISNDNISYIVNSFLMFHENDKWYYDMYWSVINTIKTLLADDGYDYCMVDYAEDSQGRLTRYCADVMRRAIMHIKNDKVKLIFSSDDLFDLKELLSFAKGGLI